MSQHEDVDGLFDEATKAAKKRSVESSTTDFQKVPAANPALHSLVNQVLPDSIQDVVHYERLRAASHRVDGLIIGTGESDFTKGNVPYHLSHKGRRFQLIDVPGIEGDESKYADTVKEAVAKAHLVFYVNGTNKKPEKSTAKKIKSYLGRGSRVCPLVNVRGNADAYEFDEDRIELGQGGGNAALEQTVDVLQATLGKNVLFDGHCVQGLLGFSALAYQSNQGRTTIHPDRERDLVRQQHNYLKHFKTNRAMYDFSQMKFAALVIHSKLDTFKEDIVESNKAKVIELLSENLQVLEESLDAHRTFIKGIEPEFKKCRESIEGALENYELKALNGRRNILNTMFDALIEDADKVVEQEFGDKEAIENEISEALKKRQKQAQEDIEEYAEDNLSNLRERLERAVTRLIEDVQRVELGQRVGLDAAGQLRFDGDTSMGWELGLGDYASILGQIGSYALSGAGIGWFAGPYGVPIGAAIGAVVGAIMAFASFLMGKEKRIRKQQRKVREKIEEQRTERLEDLKKVVNELVENVKHDVRENLDVKVDELEENLKKPAEILEQQISQMRNVKERVEKMPYGTIQTI